MNVLPKIGRSNLFVASITMIRKKVLMIIRIVPYHYFFIFDLPYNSMILMIGFTHLGEI